MSADINYPAKHYQSHEEHLIRYHQIIKDNPLATLIFSHNSESEISHIPCHFAHKESHHVASSINKHDDNSLNTTQIIAHVSNHHPLAKELRNGSIVKVHLIFHGEDAYVSPNDVSATSRQTQMVPTWNYAKVHISGNATEIKDSSKKYHHMAQATDYFEQKERNQMDKQAVNELWALTDAPETAIKHMLNAITLFTVQVITIEGRLKLSQNKTKQVKVQIANQLTIKGKIGLSQLMLDS
jgi:transcriptional regulator